MITDDHKEIPCRCINCSFTDSISELMFVFNAEQKLTGLVRCPNCGFQVIPARHYIFNKEANSAAPNASKLDINLSCEGNKFCITFALPPERISYAEE